MAIEDIFRALEEQADAECAEILRNAKEQADAIVAEAEAEAERSRQARVELARASATQRAAHTLNSARLENRKELAGVRDRAIEAVFVEAQNKLAAVRKDASYPAMLASLVDEARAVVGSYGECTLHFVPDDAALGAKLAQERGCASDASLDATGGTAATVADGRIMASNTFEDRLAKVRRNAQSHVAEMLFE